MKRERSRRDVTPRPFDSYSGTKLFLDPSDADFTTLLKTSYSGFVHESKPRLDHQHFLDGLRTMESRHLFQYDVVQAMGLGTRCSRTFVTRTLVGEKGITYKYLGLR